MKLSMSSAVKNLIVDGSLGYCQIKAGRYSVVVQVATEFKDKALK